MSGRMLAGRRLVAPACQTHSAVPTSAQKPVARRQAERAVELLQRATAQSTRSSAGLVVRMLAARMHSG